MLMGVIKGRNEKIYNLRKSDPKEYTYKKLAKMFNLSPTVVRRIVNRIEYNKTDMDTKIQLYEQQTGYKNSIYRLRKHIKGKIEDRLLKCIWYKYIPIYTLDKFNEVLKINPNEKINKDDFINKLIENAVDIGKVRAMQIYEAYCKYYSLEV